MRRLLRDIASGSKTVGDTTTLEDFSVLAKLREQRGRNLNELPACAASARLRPAASELARRLRLAGALSPCPRVARSEAVLERAADLDLIQVAEACRWGAAEALSAVSTMLSVT